MNVWGIVEELRMKFSQSRYGSLVFVGVFESGMKGGEPPVLDEKQNVKPFVRPNSFCLVEVLK